MIPDCPFRRSFRVSRFLFPDACIIYTLSGSSGNKQKTVTLHAQGFMPRVCRNAHFGKFGRYGKQEN